MKYGYEDVEDEELIQNYKTLSDKIVITFLDGTNYEIPLTKENEAYLLNKMLEQAQDRSKSSALYDAKQERKKALRWAVTEVGLTLITTINAHTTDLKWRMFVSVFCCITGICIVIDSVQYKFKNDEIKELEKYDIYLSMREALEKNIENPNLFNGVEVQQEGLNINTLDDYSLSDIETIQSNLIRSRKYSQCFTDASGASKLEKKIGK